MQTAPLKALVLTGGRSRRMGRDKAALPLQSGTLLANTVALLQKAVAEVFVSVTPEQLADPLRSAYPLIVDELTDSGPAAGICAAHSADPAAAWLVVACDMPLLDYAAISLLVHGRKPQLAATVLVAAQDDAPEPLCAIYEPATLAAFQLAVLAGGNVSPRDWLNSVTIARVVAPAERVLRGANTPAEFAELTAQSGAMNSALDRTTK